MPAEAETQWQPRAALRMLLAILIQISIQSGGMGEASCEEDSPKPTLRNSNAWWNAYFRPGK
jgi:hypothetical protein